MSQPCSPEPSDGKPSSEAFGSVCNQSSTEYNEGKVPLPPRSSQTNTAWVRLAPDRELEVINMVERYQRTVLARTTDMNRYTAELLRQIDRKMAGRDILRWEELCSVKSEFTRLPIKQ